MFGMCSAPDERLAESGRQMTFRFLGALAILCISMAEVHADIFMYTDDSGTPSFSDVPNDARYRLYMHTGQPHIQADAPQRASSIANRNRAIFNAEVKRAASFYRVDEALLHAVITAESGYNAHIVSRKGAVGLMQLMPATARRYQVNNSFDPSQNIHAGAKYLSSLLAQFDNNTQLALAAYNAGENNVRKYGGRIPPFPETIAYVPKVMGLYQRYRQELP